MWKDIHGYEGYYQISDCGSVRSVSRVCVDKNGHLRKFKGKNIKHRISRRGYCCVIFTRDCLGKHFQVHRLVAEAFIPNPGNKPQVNHIDGNKLNNHVSNLEWVTPKENTIHSYEIGLKRSKKKRVTEDMKAEMTRLRLSGKTHVEIAQIMSLSICTVSKYTSGINIIS